MLEQINSPLAVTILPGAEVALKLNYGEDWFDAETISRMLGHFRQLLRAIATDPQQRVGDLSLLTDSERQQLLYEFNDTAAEFPRDVCLHQLIEQQVARTPDQVAVISEEEQLSYRELNERANQLAHHLRSLGVKTESPVGILLERSIEMVVALLGVLKAGGAYVPLDPKYPSERVRFLLEDSRVSVLITSEQCAMTLPSHTAHLILLDTEAEMLQQYESTNPELVGGAENLAYIIYTSGSTGKPKGVMVQHRSLVNYIEAARVAFQITPVDRVLQFLSVSFDASAEEIYSCLVSGATLILRTDEMLSSPTHFLQKCREWDLTVLDVPTPYWHELVSNTTTEDWTAIPRLRLVVIGGERALSDRLAIWQKIVGSRIRLINAYGPTETTISAMLSDLTSDETSSLREAPIGRPVLNTQAYILDHNLLPLPVNVFGELYLGGEGLARGYLDRPALTAERFIPNPFSNELGARLYKTGDVVCLLPGGEIEFKGRRDRQVKVRGFRIELEEIEAVLRQ
ncbi:MAG TPA: amino acid adenylation domain-containing protein, partial [Pyrinomonadaceae bacterium]